MTSLPCRKYNYSIVVGSSGCCFGLSGLCGRARLLQTYQTTQRRSNRSHESVFVRCSVLLWQQEGSYEQGLNSQKQTNKQKKRRALKSTGRLDAALMSPCESAPVVGGLGRRPQMHCGCFPWKSVFVFKLYDSSLNSAKKPSDAKMLKIKETRGSAAPPPPHTLKDRTKSVMWEKG